VPTQDRKSQRQQCITSPRDRATLYLHTHDDLLAVGVALDDGTLENGCLLMLPGSHRWPILDPHQDGVFAGAIDVERGVWTSPALCR
jgi:ectoine hydroxylase-related dioxygenase (phytanoyl-CoA dioxygenase family)